MEAPVVLLEESPQKEKHTPKGVLIEKAEGYEREAARLNEEAGCLEAEAESARNRAKAREEAAINLRDAATWFD